MATIEQVLQNIWEYIEDKQALRILLEENNTRFNLTEAEEKIFVQCLYRLDECPHSIRSKYLNFLLLLISHLPKGN